MFINLTAQKPKWLLDRQPLISQPNKREISERPIQCDENKPERGHKRITAGILACVIAGLSTATNGINVAYPSPAIPDMNGHPNPFHVSHEEQSWIVSAQQLGYLVGALIAATLVDRCGRKATLLFMAVPNSISWLITISSENVSTMAAGRALAGLTMVIIRVAGTIYVTEVAPPHIRGNMSSLSRVFLNCGQLVVYITGAYVHWNWLAVCCLVQTVIVTILVLSLPESPRWLIAQSRVTEAAESMAWLQCMSATDDRIHEDITRIKAGLTMSSGDSVASSRDIATPWKDYFRMPLIKYLAISQSLFMLQQFSGIEIVRQYTVTMFQSTHSYNLDPFSQTIIIGTVFLAGSLTNFIIVERFQRRSLITFSAAGMALGWLGLVVYFLAIKMDIVHLPNIILAWLPLLSVTVVAYAVTLGVIGIPQLITNEMFSTNSRARANCLNMVTHSVVGFIVSKSFLNVQQSIGDVYCFGIFSLVCVTGAVFSYFFVPNTGGKRLEEVQKS